MLSGNLTMDPWPGPTKVQFSPASKISRSVCKKTSTPSLRKFKRKKNTTANYKFFTSHLPKQLAEVGKQSKNNFHIWLSEMYRVSQKKVLIEKILIEMSWKHLIVLSLSKKREIKYFPGPRGACYWWTDAPWLQQYSISTFFGTPYTFVFHTAQSLMSS